MSWNTGGSGGAGVPPVITQNPASVSDAVGTSATFGVAASGGDPKTYQWSVSTDGGATWNPVGGATASTLTLAGLTLAQTGNRYRCAVSNAGGTATSTAAVLTVTPVFSTSYGSGADGALVFDGAATVAGLVPVANVYTMTADLNATTLVVNNGVTLKVGTDNTTQFGIFATVSITCNGTILASIDGAYGRERHGLHAGSGALGGATNGAVGGAGSGVANVALGGGSSGLGGTGGNSGGAPGAQGVAGAWTPSVLHGLAPVIYAGGAGGPGGGAGAGINFGAGGGGGSGGGILLLSSPIITGNGTLSAPGQNGANGANSGALSGGGGGGSGGGGGLIMYISEAVLAGTLTTNVAGGTGGNPGTSTSGSAATAGTAGAAGQVLRLTA